MIVQRSQIRKYLAAMLKDSTDLGGKVFCCRPDAVFLEEVPCALVYFADEGAETITGDKYNQKLIERKLRVNVDVLITPVINPDVDPRFDEDSEDYLDYVSYQVERAIWSDQKLAKRLVGYDANTNYGGLVRGVILLSVTPYEESSEQGTRVLAQRLVFEMYYDTDACSDKIYDSFSHYYADINRSGDNTGVTDPILISAEGEI